MPIYEYRCAKGHTFDTMQRFSDEPLTKCEICGAAAHRVLHAPAVHFKGSGFYNTDYGTRKRSRELKEGKDGAKAESGGSSDAKPESGSSGSSASSSDGSSAAKSEPAKSAPAKAKTAG